jgi:DNA repair protein RadC
LKSIKDLPEGERPRERLLKNGAKSLSDQDLLAILIGRGTRIAFPHPFCRDFRNFFAALRITG